MARSGPTSISLPEFSGATRRLITWNVAVFFSLALLGFISAPAEATLFSHLALQPSSLVHGEVWQIFTYGFLNLGLLGTLFAMLTLWWTGRMLEERFGGRWLMELYFTGLIGGGLVASAIALTGLFHGAASASGAGPYPALFGLLFAMAVYFPDMEILFLFVLRLKVKYLVAIYLLINVAILLKATDIFTALLDLSGGLCGYLFLRFAPRKGLAHGITEQYFAVRNEFYRNKRRRAARKFEVYMKAQNREVHFDRNGRYVDPDKHDPNDKRWMN